MIGFGEHGQSHLSNGIENGYHAAGDDTALGSHQLDANDEAGGVQGATRCIVQYLKDQEPNVAGWKGANNTQHSAQNATQSYRKATSKAVDGNKTLITVGNSKINSWKIPTDQL